MALFGALRRAKMFERSAERFACQITARLELCDSGVIFEGQLINVSTGGAMFRPALAYLLSRKGVEVVLHIAGREVSGEIMGTMPQGYGLRFDQQLALDLFEHLLAFDKQVFVATA